MGLKCLYTCVIALMCGGVGYALPATHLSPGEVDLSALTYSVSDGSDVRSHVYETCVGITPKLGVTADVTSITDSVGSVDISSILFGTPVSTRRNDKISMAAFAGLTWIDVDRNYGDETHTTGLTLGTASEFRVRPELTLYSQSSVSFVDKPLWMLDMGLQYEVRPRWNLTMGYRSYEKDGSSFGGFLIGANYTVNK